MENLIDVTFTDEKGVVQHVEVVQPLRHPGGGFYVYVNGFFNGQIVQYSTGWAHFIKSNALNQDDIDAIMDLVNERYPTEVSNSESLSYPHLPA